MKPAPATDPTSEIAVTLTDALRRRLRREADRLGVPLEWLVAGLVCDTLEPPGVPAPSVRRPAVADWAPC